MEGFKDYTGNIEIPYNEGIDMTIELERIKDYFLYSIICPGLGQMKMGNFVHGSIALGSFLGCFTIYYFYLQTESDWMYRDMEFRVIQQTGGYGGAHSYIIDGKEVEPRIYQIMDGHRREEELRINSWENKKQIIEGTAFILYCLNLLDTWYLMKKKHNRENFGMWNISPEHRYQYSGIRLDFMF